MLATQDELFQVVKTLAQNLWEQRVSEASLKKWLGNFPDDQDRLLALHLLAHFSYFGVREVRELLRALYRDMVRYPIVQRVRNAHGGTLDSAIIEPAVNDAINRTRFIGMGNPSESGTHLLYYFRQENALPRNLFLNSHRIFERESNPLRVHSMTSLREPEVQRYIFIDDLCASGTQAKEYSEDIVSNIKKLKPDVEVAYYCLFGLEAGLSEVETKTAFSDVKALFNLDDSFKCFSPQSRYYLDGESTNKAEAESVMKKHGASLWPDYPCGYKDGQLLLGFCHNVPDNSLPTFWSDEKNWAPIFPRFPKIVWSAI